MSERITVSDVARKAGVSIGTVSRVLNDPSAHAAETVARVRSAMLEIGFSPRRHKNRKTAQRCKQFALFFLESSSLPKGMLTPLGVGVARGADEVFAEKHDQLVVTQTRDRNDPPMCIAERQVEGVIARLGGFACSEELMRMLVDLPCVFLLGTVPPHPRADLVTVDNYRLGWMAAQVFGKLNKTRLVIVHHADLLDEHRLRAYACEQTVDKRTVSVVCTTAENAAAALAPEALRDTAFFLVGHDHEILANYRSLVEQGLKPCESAPVICAVTDAEAFYKLDPRLHILGIDPVTLGKIAAQQLLWRIEHLDAPYRTILAPPCVYTKSASGAWVGGEN